MRWPWQKKASAAPPAPPVTRDFVIVGPAAEVLVKLLQAYCDAPKDKDFVQRQAFWIEVHKYVPYRLDCAYCFRLDGSSRMVVGHACVIRETEVAATVNATIVDTAPKPGPVLG